MPPRPSGELFPISVERLRERIPVERFRFTFSCAGGPGGQNVNKVNTRVTLWFDLAGDPALSAEEEERVRSKLASRVTADGRMHVVAMRHRTQGANRAAAIERFYELLAGALHRERPRKATKVSKGAKARRLEEKRRIGERKKMRERLSD